MNNPTTNWNSQPNLAEIINLTHFLPPKSVLPITWQSWQPWQYENQSSLTSSTVSLEEIGLGRALANFASYLIENSKNIEPEYVKIVEENFWDLLA